MENGADWKKDPKVLAGVIAVIVFAFVAVLYLGGVIGSGQMNPGAGGGSAVSPQPVPSVPLVTDPAAIRAMTTDAQNNRDLTKCDMIGISSSKEYCRVAVFTAQAGDAKNTSICNNIENPVYQSGCVDSTIIVMARDSKNPSLCSTLTDKTRVASCLSLAK